MEGLVQTTIPAQAPDRIALLRLDTDLYDSTLHELEHLYPRLTTGGVLIVDDYGKIAGATKAVDEYFAALAHPPLLQRIDVQGRIAVKPDRTTRRDFLIMNPDDTATPETLRGLLGSDAADFLYRLGTCGPAPAGR